MSSFGLSLISCNNRNKRQGKERSGAIGAKVGDEEFDVPGEWACSCILKQLLRIDEEQQAVQAALDADQFTIEIEGELMMIPKSSVKYMTVSPLPEEMPETIIRGGRIVTS